MLRIAVLLLCVTSVNAQLVIDGPKKIAPYKLVELTVSGAPADAAIIFDVYPEDNADIREGDGKLLFVAPPGTYKIKARAISGKKVLTARSEVVIGEGTKPDPPKPDPPAPTVVVKPLHILIIAESADRREEFGQLLSDENLQGYIRSKGYKWRLVDRDVKDTQTNETPKDLKPWFARYANRLPIMSVVDNAGKLLYEGTVLDAKGSLDFLRRYD